VKHGLLEFLVGARRSGKRIVAYGAAAKGNTLLNYCGVGRDFIDYVVDRSPHKQDKFLPGTHLPIAHPERIAETRPTTCSCCPGISGRDHRAEPAHSQLGRAILDPNASA